jgi:hypothetical protein
MINALVLFDAHVTGITFVRVQILGFVDEQDYSLLFSSCQGLWVILMTTCSNAVAPLDVIVISFSILED